MRRLPFKIIAILLIIILFVIILLLFSTPPLINCGRDVDPEFPPEVAYCNTFAKFKIDNISSDTYVRASLESNTENLHLLTECTLIDDVAGILEKDSKFTIPLALDYSHVLFDAEATKTWVSEYEYFYLPVLLSDIDREAYMNTLTGEIVYSTIAKPIDLFYMIMPISGGKLDIEGREAFMLGQYEDPNDFGASYEVYTEDYHENFKHGMTEDELIDRLKILLERAKKYYSSLKRIQDEYERQLQSHS